MASSRQLALKIAQAQWWVTSSIAAVRYFDDSRPSEDSNFDGLLPLISDIESDSDTPPLLLPVEISEPPLPLPIVNPPPSSLSSFTPSFDPPPEPPSSDPDASPPPPPSPVLHRHLPNPSAYLNKLANPIHHTPFPTSERFSDRSWLIWRRSCRRRMRRIG